MTNRLKLTNDDLKDAFDFRKHLNIPDRKIYCTIYGKVYYDKDENWIFNTKEDLIETFMTSDIFKPLWNEIVKATMHKYGAELQKIKAAIFNKVNSKYYQNGGRPFISDFTEINNYKKFFEDDKELQQELLLNSDYMKIHNKIEDCINYYKEVAINRMIRKRVIIFHKEA